MIDGDGDDTGDSEAEPTEQVWLVDRQYSDTNLITVVYATTDGERHYQQQLSHTLLGRTPVTAAKAVPVEKLEPVADADERGRYATQAQRMAQKHAPDEEI